MDGNKYLESYPANAISSENRNFSLPREPYFGSGVPLDVSNADDSNIINQVQVFLKSSPLGVSYSGPIDGKINSIFLDAVSKFESAVQAKFPSEKIVGTIRSGNNISSSGFAKAISLLKNEPKKTEKPEDKSQNRIAEFQKYFGLNPTGIADDKLANAAKATELMLSKNLEDPTIKGLLWNDSTKSFNTSVADLQSALNLAAAYKKKNSK